MCCKCNHVSIFIIYLFSIACRFKTHDTMSDKQYSTTQIKTYIQYLRLRKQNTFHKEMKISQNKTAWISISSLLQREHQKENTNLRTTASNDETLLYTNSFDALHHLGSRNNFLKASLYTTCNFLFEYWNSRLQS